MVKQNTKKSRMRTFKGVFVDPENVNSTVRYMLESTFKKDGSTRFDGSISFGDCNRVISWESGWEGDARTFLEKLDTAVHAIRDCRTGILLHITAADEHAKKKGKVKKK